MNWTRFQQPVLFCGKRRDRIKALLWEGDGFVLLYKRMENGGGFQWPRSCAEMRSLSWQEFRWLTEGLSIDQPKANRGWNGAFCEVKFSTKNQAIFAADLIEFLQEVLCADSSQCELFCCIIGVRHLVGGCHAEIETGISELLKRQPVTEQEKDAYIQDLQKALRLLLEEVRDLEEMVALLQKKRFGSSARRRRCRRKKSPWRIPGSRAGVQRRCPEPFKKDQRGVHKISEAGRWKLTSSNETENRIFDLDEEERICPRCKGKLVWIGKELVRKSLNTSGPNSSWSGTGR